MEAFDVMMIALRLNEKINKRNLEGLTRLMTDDHTFIDNSGAVDAYMKARWRGFFEKYPDYRNTFTSVTGNVVVTVGYSTCSNDRS